MSMDAAVAETGFDPREFRTALGQFATGVTVVTAPDGEGGYVGTTASSFNSVSVDPPLILWSIDNGARSLGAYENAEHFVVNILAADQVTLSNHFARQQEDKFADVDFDLNAQGVPALRECSAWFHCKTRYMYEGGDHTIIVGEVIRYDNNHRDGLLFHQGRYSISDAHPAAAKPAEEEIASGERSFAENYLHYLVGRCFQQLMGKLDRMLEKRDITQAEYRVLASFSGLSGADTDTLAYYTILSPEQLQPVLRSLAHRGLICGDPQGYTLTEAGQALLMPLMAVAKSNEADLLGAFSAEEAQRFKQMLKRAISWTES
jgi:flavin reductase (DIM6/NTAB) family NADH-FMN oxidoreductase RutF/DNA-binding MarR family transcriptional regulator